MIAEIIFEVAGENGCSPVARGDVQYEDFIAAIGGSRGERDFREGKAK